MRTGLAVLLLTLSLPSTWAFDRERPGRPEDGASVTRNLEFFIAAEGTPDPEDRYRIEVGNEDFDTVLYTFDQSENEKGWVWSDPGDSAPSQQEADWWRGLFFRPPTPLPEGEYVWRALKHDGVEFRSLPGQLRFRVDLTPPAAVTGLRMSCLESGAVLLRWRQVVTDERGEPERVAGYRIYRYVRRAPFHSGDLFMVGEMLDTEFLDEYASYDEDVVSYYRVTAVDEAGNEAGRLFPVPLGHTR